MVVGNNRCYCYGDTENNFIDNTKGNRENIKTTK